MKTILVLTDFSEKADYASDFALKLAQKTSSDLLLCNMFLVPYIEPMTTQLAWPVENYNTLEADSKNDLRRSKARLESQLDYELDETGHRPVIELLSESGSIADIFYDIVKSHNVMMAVIGQHNHRYTGMPVFEDHTRRIIEKADFPVLVVPDFYQFKGFNKIAFATDLSTSDVDVLNDLTDLARSFGSEILVTHVEDENVDDTLEARNMQSFFNMVKAEANYPKITSRTIKEKTVTSGLDWLSEKSDVDLLVLVHRKRNFFYRLLEGSVTHHMSNHISKPLLVIPGSKVAHELSAK